MKITKTYLKQVIKEAIEEMGGPMGATLTIHFKHSMTDPAGAGATDVMLDGRPVNFDHVQDELASLYDKLVR